MGQQLQSRADARPHPQALSRRRPVPAHAAQVVLDVGTGSGILAIFAAKAGAKKVYAVEATDMAKHARKLVEHNKVCWRGGARGVERGGLCKAFGPSLARCGPRAAPPPALSLVT